jgi:lysophospholipase L1-like esterase
MTKVRQQIRILHRLAPYAAIMMVGPSDMLLYEKGERHSYAILPAIDTALKEVAAEEQATYWSLFEAMGGAGAMATWQDKGWAGRDGIHFTRDGADKAGKMLTDFLLQPLQNAIE